MRNPERKPLTLSYQRLLFREGADGRLVVAVMIAIIGTMLWMLFYSGAL
jgi:hypothetical protein